jgi:hypothetical protein
MRHAALTRRTSDLSASCGGHEFSLGVAFAFPGSHEQHFASERITEYVVDIGRAIDFKETRTADVCPVQPRPALSRIRSSARSSGLCCRSSSISR